MRPHNILFVAAAAVTPLATPVVALAQSEADAILLHGAIRDGDIDAVRGFLDRGVPVNTLNSGGYSPLMTAANAGKLEIVQMLLARGADTTIKTSSGWDAAFLAQLNGHPAVVAALKGPPAPPAQAVAATPPPAPATAAAPRPSPAAPARPPPAAQTAQGGGATWPRAGAFRVGEQVLYSGTAGKTWQRGVIRSIDPQYGYNIEGVTGSFDPFFVTAIGRQPYWTGYFVGDWRISVPMAMNLMTDGRDVYRVVTGGMRLPPLRINADGTYSWRVVETGGRERLIQGRWRPNPDGPGVILQNGEKGADWLVYNNSRTGSQLGQTVILSSDQHTYQDGTRLQP